MTRDLHEQAIDSLRSGGRILVTRLEYLGDVILTLPLLRALKSRFPEAPIDYLARSPGADILAGEALVDRVLEVPARGAGAFAWVALVRELGRREYAVAIDLYSNPRSALLTRLSGAAMRIGGARRARRRLYTHAIAVPRGVRSAIEHHLYHLVPLGISEKPTKPELNPTREVRDRARE
jgi:heptosyltransferase-2/heptosyltransferase-3